MPILEKYLPSDINGTSRGTVIPSGSASWRISDRVKFNFTIPLSEIIVDFYERIKSLTRGYGSIDYEFLDYMPTKLTRIDILLNSVICEAFSVLVHKDKVQQRGKQLVEKMRKLIPRQLFEVAIQAAIGSRIIARQNVAAMRKNVTAKCYGGDITRKRKLLEKQKEGKKRMRQVGKVEVPQEAFMAVLQV